MVMLHKEKQKLFTETSYIGVPDGVSQDAG